MCADRVVDLGDRGCTPGHLVVGVSHSLRCDGPLAGRTAGRREVPQVFRIDPVDQQRLGARQLHGLPCGDVECARQRIAPRQVNSRRRRRLQHALRLPEWHVDGFVHDRAHPLVCLVPRQLLATGGQHGELRLGALVEPLAIDESVRARADLGGDLGAHVGVGRLDLLDFLLGGPVLGLHQQVQRLDHRRLADLVGAADHHHTVIGELDLAVGDAAVVRQDQPVQSHASAPARPLPCGRGPTGPRFAAILTRTPLRISRDPPVDKTQQQ